MNKTLTRKLIYIIAALVLLVGMLPITAVPVSAATAAVFSPLVSHDIIGHVQRFTVTGLATNETVTRFEVHPNGISETGFAPTITANSTTGTNPWVEVQSFVMGEAVVQAYLSSGLPPIEADKKWGKIDRTEITPPQDQVLVWSESNKTWSSNATIIDQVWGTYWLQNPVLHTPHIWEYPGPIPVYDAGTGVVHPGTVIEPLGGEGAVLHYFLLQDNPTTQAWVASHSGTLMPSALLSQITTLALTNKAVFTSIVGSTTVTLVNSTHATVITDANGKGTINVIANGEEPVLVLVVPAYPSTNENQVILEWTKINFWTSEMEKVPQVRWAGEKIVLEKFFGQGLRTNAVNPALPIPWAGTLVRFSLENQSPGALEGFGPGGNLVNLTNTAQTVWSVVGLDGYARCMLVSEAPGEVDVDLAVYNENIMVGGDGDNLAQSIIINQHGFVVFYLKLESITLGDVIGKRAEHNSGLWGTPVNPWNAALDWEVVHPGTPEPLNVSQDTLLRARVRGWFMGDNMSTRNQTIQDYDLSDTNTDGEITLPYGRWVLPDDWAKLAGPDWREQRIHWNIMDTPFDTVGAIDPLGPYRKPYTTGTIMANTPVVGPFRPGLEVPNSTGYDPNIPGYVVPQQKTVVPDGLDNVNNLNWWDAPMPPAKITFEITNGVGFFKDAMKADIYYVMSGTTKVYTNPFYAEMIPAFSQIPAFVNNGGYDWDSWNTSYGPYWFWDIFNRPPGIVGSSDSSNYPTKAQVYSDNHGEAMIYLNGNWNLGLTGTNGGSDVIFGSTVGTSKVVAMADYPYFRKHPKLVSAPVNKTWQWGGQILGPDSAQLAPMVLTAGTHNNASSDFITLDAGFTFQTVAPWLDPVTDADAQGTSNKHIVWIWATDRDARQAGVLDTKVDWALAGAGATFYNGVAFHGINDLGPNSTMLDFDANGFLKNTAHPGVRATGSTVTSGTSWLRAPTTAEAAIFTKFWPSLNPNNFAVTAIDVFTSGSGTVVVTEYITGPDYGYVGSPLGTVIRQTDFTTTLSYPLDDQMILGDANLDGNVNMMDITAVERIILGMQQSRVAQADANYNNVIDMGDVIRIEKTYLGLK